MNTQDTQETSLATVEESPSTFAGMRFASTSGSGLVPVSTAALSTCAGGISTANKLHGFIARQEETVRQAARNHLLATLSLGCVLRSVIGKACSQGLVIKALFSDYKLEKESDVRCREAILKFTGGHIFSFSYRTSRRYIDTFEKHAKRVAAASTQAEANRILAEHASMLISGAYENPIAEIHALWEPYVTATSLRQAYLELAPDAPSNLTKEAEKIQDEVQEGFATWEAQRKKLCADFGGLFLNLDTLIGHSSRLAQQDRLAMADKLEAAARRLRATQTQPDLPGIEDAAPAQDAATL